MSELMQPSSGFMKRKTGHWFWAALAVLLITFFTQIGYSALFPKLATPSSTGILTAVALAASALTSGAMFAVLLAYGLCSTVKTYRALFVILACMQAPAAAGGFLANFATISLLTSALPAVNALRLASAILSLLVTAAWIACLLIIVFGKQATGVLRASAALLAGYLLLNAIYTLFIQGPLTMMMYRQRADAYMLQTILNTVRNVASIVLNVFFFAAMSFSKRRPTHAAAATQPPAV